MKQISRILITIFIILGILLLSVICLLVGYFDREKPFDNILPDGTPYTYSVGLTEFEIELEYRDALKLRRFLYEFTLISKTPERIFNLGRHNTLNVYMPNGDKHSIVFKGSKEIMGFPIGIIDYNGVEYFVDHWLYEYGELFCSSYHDEYLKWR